LFIIVGTAIYINSLVYEGSPLYTVTLDGVTTDVDGALMNPGRYFSCDAPLFSRDGLDAGKEHEIMLATKGLSSIRNNTSGGGNLSTWSLISFV
jgi:hypothetical protein